MGPCTTTRVAEDPHIRRGGMLVTQQYAEIGEYRVIGNPIRMSETPPSYRTPPPLGADTDAVLTELGFSVGEIRTLREDEVV